MRKLIRFLIKTAGAAGILSICFTAFQIFFPATEIHWENFPIELSNSLLVILGLGLCLVWLLFSQGYKKLPFWVNLFIGSVLIGLSLYRGQLPFVINDGFFLAAGLFFLVVARYAAKSISLSRRRFIYILPALALQRNFLVGKEYKI